MGLKDIHCAVGPASRCALPQASLPLPNILSGKTRFSASNALAMSHQLPKNTLCRGMQWVLRVMVGICFLVVSREFRDFPLYTGRMKASASHRPGSCRDDAVGASKDGDECTIAVWQVCQFP
jgi:hypothetical protein